MQVFPLNVIILCYVRVPIFQNDGYHGNNQLQMGTYDYIIA